VRVVLCGHFWFPAGTAAGARIRNLALGLRDCGASVHVIPVGPQPRPVGSENGIGIHEGVSYEFVSPWVARCDGFRDADETIPNLRREPIDKVRWFAGLFGSMPLARKRLAQRIDEGGCDLVLLYDRSIFRAAPLVDLCRKRGVTTVLDITEVSEHLGGSRLNPLYWDSRAGTSRIPRLVDGLTVITSGLEEIYRARGCRRIMVLPGIEEWPEAAPLAPTRRSGFRLTYVGALQGRDAPEMLLAAFKILKEEGRDVTLEVAGHYLGTERGRRFIEEWSNEPTLAESVRFLGSLGDAALRAQLESSDGLILTRRRADTEILSFPTRLVEFLKVGRPVLVSDVGDVSRYLKDGEDGVLLDAVDPRRVARQIGAVMDSPDRGAGIGRQGRQAGARAFDRRVHAGRLLEFASELRYRRAS
jgi:glycosyltransferase involved in cell wall biosynthesis